MWPGCLAALGALGACSGHNSTLTASERHSAVTFLLKCVNLPAQDDGHHTPNSITTHPFRELKLILIKLISSDIGPYSDDPGAIPARRANCCRIVR
jgi:hypothetical protein